MWKCRFLLLYISSVALEWLVKIIFVDGENVGLKGLMQIKSTFVDKVFVFGKSNSIQQFCNNSFFYQIADYPTGQNQADFYIIAYLSRIIAKLESELLLTTHIVLYTNDENLILAYEFQCKKFGCKFTSKRTVEKTVIKDISDADKLEVIQDKIYTALKKPMALDPIFQERLGLPKQIFTTAVNQLIRSNKIRRSTESKKMWVQC